MAKKRIGFGDLYCVVCGDRIEKGAQRCPKCGSPYGDEKFSGVPQMGAAGVGWSDRAGDPTFRRNSKKNTRGILIFMVLVSVVILVVMTVSGQLDPADGGWRIFGGIMLILWGFWILWLLFSNGKRRDWEGVVERKEQYREKHTTRDADGDPETTIRTVYKVTFRREKGGAKTLVTRDNSAWYDYLREGDRVRYHGKHMNYYEKYDKSRDTSLPCASCSALRDARETYCGRCGAILLKGKADPYLSTARQSGAASAAVRPAPARAVGITNFCPHCGAKISGGAFCQECGGKL